MKKFLLLMCISLGLSTLTYAQQGNPCDFLETTNVSPADYFDDLKNALQQNLPQLKKTRQWARKNNKPKVELATNRLEYWAKKMIQAIDQNTPQNVDLLCEKFQKELLYMNDFAQLTVMFILTHTTSIEKVDYSNYK